MLATIAAVRFAFGLVLGALVLYWVSRQAPAVVSAERESRRQRASVEEALERHCEREAAEEAARRRRGRGHAESALNTKGSQPTSGSQPAQGGLGGKCSACWDREATIGFLHPGIVHVCLCGVCWHRLRKQGTQASSRCVYCNQLAIATTKVVGT